jgi:hypothetical protein
VHKTVRTRRPPKPTPKRNIPAWSSTISSSAPLFSHPSTSISQTPYQLPPAGPTCQPVFIPRSAFLPRPTSFLANSTGARYVRRPSLPALSGEQEKEPETAAQPRAPRRGPTSTSPASLELPDAVRPQAPRRGFLSGGRCRAGARRRARPVRSCGGRRPLLHLLLPLVAPLLLQVDPAEIELPAMEARSEAPSPAPLPPEPPPPPPRAGPLW